MTTTETTARALVVLMEIGVFSTVAFLVISWPFYFFFVTYRRKQIHHPHYDALTANPYHVALTNFFTAAYGVLLPALSFPAIRSHRYVLEWEFSQSVHAGWKMALASVAMVWLGARLIEASINSDRPRFRGWTDRIFAALGVAICLFYHSTLIRIQNLRSPHWVELILIYLLPQVCVLGTTLVYALALIETTRPGNPVPRPRRKTAWVLAATAILLVFTPLLLAKVRVSHKQALNLIETHLDQIDAAARAAELDPRLLAGVIYVAQTRDKPAVYGKTFDRLCYSILFIHGDSWAWRTLPDPKLGLCAMNYDNQARILGRMNQNNMAGSAFNDSIKTALIFSNLHGMTIAPAQDSIKVPDILAEMIMTSPAMDPVLDGVVENYDNALHEAIRGSLPVQREAYLAELFMPTLRYTCGVSRPMQAIVNASSHTSGHNFDCYFLKDHIRVPIVTEFIDMCPDRTRVLRPPTRQSFSYAVPARDLLKVVDDAEASILIGAAMLKTAAIEAVADPAGGDRIDGTIRRCPYAHPADFARRLKKIMQSPELGRMFAR